MTNRVGDPSPAHSLFVIELIKLYAESVEQERGAHPMRAARHPRIYEAAASTPGFPLGLFPVSIQDICQLHIDALEQCATDDERWQRILPGTRL